MALSPLLGLYGSLDERALKLGVLFRYWAKVRYIYCDKAPIAGVVVFEHVIVSQVMSDCISEAAELLII